MQLLDDEEFQEYSYETSMAGQIFVELLSHASQDIANEGMYMWTTSAEHNREKAVGPHANAVRCNKVRTTAQCL